MPSQESDNAAQADESPVVAEHVCNYVLEDSSVAGKEIFEDPSVLLSLRTYLCLILC